REPGSGLGMQCTDVAGTSKLANRFKERTWFGSQSHVALMRGACPAVSRSRFGSFEPPTAISGPLPGSNTEPGSEPRAERGPRPGNLVREVLGRSVGRQLLVLGHDQADRLPRRHRLPDRDPEL